MRLINLNISPRVESMSISSGILIPFIHHCSNEKKNAQCRKAKNLSTFCPVLKKATVFLKRLNERIKFMVIRYILHLVFENTETFINESTYFKWRITILVSYYLKRQRKVKLSSRCVHCPGPFDVQMKFITQRKLRILILKLRTILKVGVL